MAMNERHPSDQCAGGEPATQSPALAPAEAESRAALEQRKAAARSQRQIDAGALPSNQLADWTSEDLDLCIDEARYEAMGFPADDLAHAVVDFLIELRERRAADVATLSPAEAINNLSETVGGALDGIDPLSDGDKGQA